MSEEGNKALLPDSTYAANDPVLNRLAARQSLVMILLVVAGNLLYLAYDGSNQFLGFDHNHLNNLYIMLDQSRNELGNHYTVPGHGDLHSLFHTAALGIVHRFGMNHFSLTALPLFGFLILLVFGRLLGRQLSGGSPAAGWLAASFLALSPFAFGLSRKFDPSTLILGLGAAVLLCTVIFQKTPSFSRALAFALCLMALLAVPLDGTVRPLAAFFAAAPFGIVLIDAVRKKTLPIRSAFLIVLLIAVIVLFGMLFILPATKMPRSNLSVFYGVDLWALGSSLFHGEWAKAFEMLRRIPGNITETARLLFFPQPGYYTSEWGRLAEPQSLPIILCGYLLDMFFNSLHPIAAVLFFVFIAAFFFLDSKGRLWILIPAIMIGVLSLVPKKNTWYIFQGLVFLPVLAGAGLALLAQRVNRKAAVALISLCHLALLGQYLHCTLFAAPPSNSAWLRAMDTKRSVCARVDRTPNNYRNLVNNFLARFDDLFAGKNEVRLGIVMDSGDGLGLVPYLLRASGKPVRVIFAAMPDSPELGDGLDAVLFFLPINDGGADAVLGDERQFFFLYVEEVFNLVKGPPYHPLEPASFEDARRRLDLWKSGRVVTFDLGMRLFLPPAAPPSAGAESAAAISFREKEEPFPIGLGHEGGFS